MFLSKSIEYSQEELNNEEWKCFHIVTKPQKYYKRGTKLYVSNLGRCKADNIIITPKTKKNGYLYFWNTPLHRLIYSTFIEENIKGLDIDHIDRNRQNNRLINLRTCTRSENMANPLTQKHLKERCNDEDYKQKLRKQNIGRVWLNNGIIRTKQFPENCEKYIQQGWTYGWKLTKIYR